MQIDYNFVFLILGIQILYVSLLTVRMILMVKGLKYFAAAISIVEVSIHIVALSLVLAHIKESFFYIIVYSGGYAIGVLIGSKIEELLALGYVTVQVIIQDMNSDLADRLRQAGYGVTSWLGSGMDGDRVVLHVLTKRKNMRALVGLINQIESKAFILSHEPLFFQGGFWARRMG